MNNTQSVDQKTTSSETKQQNHSERSTRTLDHLLTVVIPNYGYGRYIQRAIDSVVTQDYGPIELIVVDDGSRDDSVSVA